MTNADVLVPERLDEVVVLAPMACSGRDPSPRRAGSARGGLRRCATRRLEREIGWLESAGSQVRIFTPTPEDVAVIGPNVMDAGRRPAVFSTAFATTAVRLTSPSGAEGYVVATGQAVAS